MLWLRQSSCGAITADKETYIKKNISSDNKQDDVTIDVCTYYPKMCRSTRTKEQHQEKHFQKHGHQSAKLVTENKDNDPEAPVTYEKTMR